MAVQRRNNPSGKKPDPQPIDWDKISDDELLSTRICDLPIAIAGTVLEDRINAVYGELSEKGIEFHPEVYLGDEWFSPEGDPIVSIPYYLAHPRLIKLEKARVLEAEGESAPWFLKLLRHEMGHAISHAFRLHRYPGYTSVFGRSAEAYPNNFRPRPYSRRYVQHLFEWYAQVHPDEDYAETFAVWLTPGRDWRMEYARWPALRKLEFVDKMMRYVTRRPPFKKSGPKWRRVETIKMTIGYSHKLKHRAMEEDFPDYFDRDLRSIFSQEPAPKAERAGRFLRRQRRRLVSTISKYTLEKRFTVQSLIKRLAERADQLKLYVSGSEADALTQVAVCMTAMAKNYFFTGKFKRSR